MVSQLIRVGDENEDIYRALIYDKLSSNLGMIFENIVAQMLKASGHDLHFHEYKYQGEDMEKEKKYPIKVQDRYIIYSKDLKFADGITYLPVYMTGCL